MVPPAGDDEKILLRDRFVPPDAPAGANKRLGA
jgi:hypothetical protein